MGHGSQLFWIVGDLGAEAGVVPFKPAKDDWESR